MTAGAFQVDQDGYYSFHGLPIGVYTVVPSLAGWIFATDQSSVDLVALAQVDFKGTLGISGYFITIDSVSVNQPLSGNISVPFIIRLSKPAAFIVNVEYRTQDGTATAAGNDYVPVAAQQITLNSGEIKKTIFITINSGPIGEGEENFKVYLQNPEPSAMVQLIPDADFGVCTITISSNFRFLPLVFK